MMVVCVYMQTFAHPINAECREFIQDSVLAEYEAEVIKAQEPGYVSRYEAFGDE